LTDEETRKIEKVLAETLQPLESLLDRMVAPDGMLGGLRLDVETIRLEQEYQGRDIEAIHLDMRGLHGTVDRMSSEMPEKWNDDIDTKIESKFTARDDASGLVEEAVLRERQRAKEEQESSSNGFLRDMFRGTGKYLFMVVIFFAMTLGGVLLSQCNGRSVQPEDLEAYGDKLMERLDKRIEDVNGKPE
jgi:hypothetical protein